MTDQSDDLDDIQALLQQPAPPYDPDQSLRRVLSQARRQTTTRDILSFFISWLWLLFAGFGASMHGAHMKMQQQKLAAGRVRHRTKSRPQPDQA